MSFGPTATTKTAENNLGGTSNLALNNQFPAVTAAGTNALNTGSQNVTSGTNFFNTILNGNQANTQAMLQPNINQIKDANTNSLTALSTLMPRGGGRAGTLFNASYAPNAQIQGLFNNARTSAATALPQIGLAQEGIGTNLFGLGNQALSTAAGANASLGGLSQQQQQISNALWSNLGSGLLGLGTLGGKLGLFGTAAQGALSGKSG